MPKRKTTNLTAISIRRKKAKPITSPDPEPPNPTLESIIEPSFILQYDPDARHRIQLAYCCMHTQFPTCSSTLKAKNFSLERAIEIANQNIRRTGDLLAHNELANLRFFRITSDLLPHYSNRNLVSDTQRIRYLDAVRPALRTLGKFVSGCGHRLITHPGQFDQIGTPSDAVFLATQLDLEYHAAVLDAMGCGRDALMIVHIGGVYGDRSKTAERYVANFLRLPTHVQQRLALENDEKQWGIADVLDISQTIRQVSKSEVCVPVIFDWFHDQCFRKAYPEKSHLSPAQILPSVFETWRDYHGVPVMHVSEQAKGRRTFRLCEEVT